MSQNYIAYLWDVGVEDDVGVGAAEAQRVDADVAAVPARLLNHHAHPSVRQRRHLRVSRQEVQVRRQKSRFHRDNNLKNQRRQPLVACVVLVQSHRVRLYIIIDRIDWMTKEREATASGLWE